MGWIPSTNQHKLPFWSCTPEKWWQSAPNYSFSAKKLHQWYNYINYFIICIHIYSCRYVQKMLKKESMKMLITKGPPSWLGLHIHLQNLEKDAHSCKHWPASVTAIWLWFTQRIVLVYNIYIFTIFSTYILSVCVYMLCTPSWSIIYCDIWLW